MQIQIAFLKSKVAKRFFFLFVASSIVPIFLVGLLSYNYVTSILTEQKQEHLSSASKAYGMAIYDRLLIADEQFNSLANEIREQGLDINSELQIIDSSALSLFSDIKLRRNFDDFDNIDLKHLYEEKNSIYIVKNINSELNIYFLKMIKSDGIPLFLSVNIEANYLFHDEEYFSGAEDACVVIKNIGTLRCSEQMLATKSESIFENDMNYKDHIQKISIGNENYAVSAWELFLKGRFNTQSWLIYYAEPSDIIYAPIHSFLRILLPTLLLAVLIISLLSLNQISKILVPLEKLIVLTKAVAKSDFNEKVEFSSNDEFQDLGESFNFMTSELQKREANLIRLAHYDHLTGLPSRQLLLEKMDDLLTDSESTSFVFLFVDLDRFKVINDSHGHHIGDKLLIIAAKRIKSCVTDVNVVARYGGDEFGVVIAGEQNASSIKQIAKSIIETLSEPFYIDNYEQFIGASIGVSMFPNDGNSSQDLVQKADIAMYKAKQRGRGKCIFFSDAMQNDIREKLKLETDLFHALEKDELHLVYQPQINLETDNISGAEVLLRWKHHELGAIRPDRFIDYAEGNGFIVPLGKWAIRETIKQCEQWQIEHQALPKIAINVSPKQLYHENFISDVEELIADIEIGTTNIEFEITESIFLNDENKILEILKRINQLGIGIAIDDFGKGYSSLSYLKKFPTQTLKIDRLFIKDIDADKESRAIVKAIIAMGTALNKIVVAEGVETVEQLNILKKLGCHHAQGYYISKPKSADELMGHTQSRIIQIEQFKSNYKLG